MQLTVEFEFSASHQIHHHAGACRNLHGHNYVLFVEIQGAVDPGTGFVADFHTIEEVVQREILDRVDHRHINDFLELPTAEVMVAWFWRLLAPHLPLASLRLYETRRYCATYRGEPGVEVRFTPGHAG